ncbi:MAG: LTA synthase family protein [Spirochaetes bacterium]|nr:LTA synthase family protein [Spirochaetota bacterium]
MKIKFNEDSDVIYLHLESLNSKVANGDVLINGKHYDQPAAPVFLKFAEKGLYFPEFYNTTITTIQNQESILCGVSDNLDGPQAKQKEDFPFKCLPEIFKENGYTTYFFKAHRLGFANTGNYMKKIGFDFVINREIMKEGDKETKWGFNDDIFYQRIFEFLSREKAEKKFVYIAVSSLMHWPFKTKEEYKHLRVYPDPKNPYQTIANATRQQDEMLHSFIKSFEQYDKSDTHLFVFGDHSVPVGINNTLNVWGGLYDDIYLTSMFYIPPNPLQHRIIKERYNHISLFHTILELLSENYMSDLSISDITPNSLNKKDRFIRLNQPLHDRQIAIVRYPHKWTYHFYRREVVYFNLSKDRFEQNPIVLAKNFEKAQFIKFVESDERKRKKMEKE